MKESVKRKRANDSELDASPKEARRKMRQHPVLQEVLHATIVVDREVAHSKVKLALHAQNRPVCVVPSLLRLLLPWLVFTCVSTLSVLVFLNGHRGSMTIDLGATLASHDRTVGTRVVL